MTSTGVRTAEHPESNGDCMTAVASLLVGAGFFSLWFWLLPGWLGFHVETTGAARWRWIAAVPSVLGFAVVAAARAAMGEGKKKPGWNGRVKRSRRRCQGRKSETQKDRRE